jgi:hypothetical protein
MPDGNPECDNAVSPDILLENIAGLLTEAGRDIHSLDLARLSPTDIATLRQLGQLARDVGQDTELQSKRAIQQSGRLTKPIEFTDLNPDIATERILYTDELPLWIPEDPMNVHTITVIDQHTIASDHNTYTFPLETSQDKLVLGLFNALFACRLNFPTTSDLMTTRWAKKLGDPRTATYYLHDIINEITATAGTPYPMASFERVGMGRPLRIGKSLLLASLARPENDQQNN